MLYENCCHSYLQFLPEFLLTWQSRTLGHKSLDNIPVHKAFVVCTDFLFLLIIKSSHLISRTSKSRCLGVWGFLCLKLGGLIYLGMVGTPHRNFAGTLKGRDLECHKISFFEP